MSLVFEEAVPADIPAILNLLRDDVLGASRETTDPSPYERAFAAMRQEPHNHLIVGKQDQQILATYQITFISGLSLGATRRAQIESVRIASALRGQGEGQRMLADAEARARAAGCGLLQLTMNATRERSHRFYEQLGFTPSHIGFKRVLS